jgi:hypothetical protein
MKITTKQLKEIIKEVVSEQIPGQPTGSIEQQDLALIESVKTRFEQAMDMIQHGLESYTQVMKILAERGKAGSTKEIGNRGIHTSEVVSEQWRAISDDLYVAKNNLKYND